MRDNKMKVYDSYTKENPQRTTNPLSKLLVNWVRRYVVISKTLPWQQHMHYPLLEEDLVVSVRPKMVEHFKAKKSLLWTSFRAHWREFTEIFFALVLISGLQLSTAFFLAGIVRIMQGTPDEIKQQTNLIALNFVAILIANLLSYTFEGYYRFRFYYLNFKIKTAILSMLTEKILKFSSLNSDRFSQGKIINLIQVDVTSLDFFVQDLGEIVRNLLTFVIGFCIVCYILGYGALMFLTLSIIFNIMYGTLYYYRVRYQKELLKFKDDRVSFLKTVLKNVEYIKLNCLENFYCFKVFQKRMEEVSRLWKLAVLKAMGISIQWFMPGLFQVVVYWYYMYFAPAESFDFANFLGFMQIYEFIKFSLFFFNVYLNRYLEILISFRRLDEFMNSEDIDLGNLEVIEPRNGDETAIKIAKGNFVWGQKSAREIQEKSSFVERAPRKRPSSRDFGLNTERELINSKTQRGEPGDHEDEDGPEPQPRPENDSEPSIFALKNINIEINHGEKVFVIGRSGAGKSSLLYSILGEMTNIDKKETKSYRNGSVMFLGQDPWTIGDTAKNNILLGSEEDKKILKEVLKMAQMETDIKSMTNGLETILGDTGHTISGGQRARLALARCFYQK